MKICLFVDGCIKLFVNVFLLLDFICLILKKNESICFMIKVILVLLVFDNRLD